MPDYKKLVFTPPPEATPAPEESTSVEQAIRNGLGWVTRIGSGVLANEGGPLGAAISGGGDYLAQAIEKGKGTKLLELNPMNLNKAEIAAETAIGAIPLGKAIKAGKGIRSALMTGGLLGASTEARKYAQDDPTDSGGRTGIDALVKPNGKVGLTNPLDWSAIDKAAVLGGAALGGFAGHKTMSTAERAARDAKKAEESAAAKAAAEANVPAPKYGEVHPNKKIADAAAAKMNAEGNAARVIPHTNGYQVIPADFKAEQLEKAAEAAAGKAELEKATQGKVTTEENIVETVTPKGIQRRVVRKKGTPQQAELAKEKQQDAMFKSNVADLNAKEAIDQNAERLAKLEAEKEGKEVNKSPVFERTNAKNELGEDVSQTTTFREPPEEDGDDIDALLGGGGTAPAPKPQPKFGRKFDSKEEAEKYAKEVGGKIKVRDDGYRVVPPDASVAKRGVAPIATGNQPVSAKSMGVDLPTAEAAAKFQKENNANVRGRKKGAAPIKAKSPVAEAPIVPATPDVNAEAAAKAAFDAAPGVTDVPADELAQRAKWTSEGNVPPVNPDDLPPTPPTAPTPKGKGPRGPRTPMPPAGAKAPRGAKAKANIPLKESEKGIVFESKSPEENATRLTPEVRAEVQKMADELSQPNDGRLFKQLPSHRQIQEATPMAPPGKNGKLAKMSSEINQQKALQYAKEVLEGKIDSRHHEGVLAAAEARLAKNAERAAEDARLADTLDTGETQPRLPEAGAVREVENATPKLADESFSLSSEAAQSKPQASGDLLADAETNEEKLARLKKDLANPELSRYHNTMKRQVQYLEQQMAKGEQPIAEAAAKGKAPSKAPAPPVDYREAFKNAKKNLKRVGASDAEIQAIIAKHPNDVAKQIEEMKLAHAERWEPIVNNARGSADQMPDLEFEPNAHSSAELDQLEQRAGKLGRLYRQYQEEFKAGKRPEIEARAAGSEASRLAKEVNKKANEETLALNKDLIEGKRPFVEPEAPPAAPEKPKVSGRPRGAFKGIFDDPNAPKPEAPKPTRKGSIKARAKGEKGEINPALLARGGAGVLGATLGASEDEEHPLRGALIGGAAGAALPSLGSAINSGAAGKVMQKFERAGELMPDFQRFNLLADPVGLPANTVAGPIGSAFFGALEKALQNDKRGLAVMKDLATSYNWPKNFWYNLTSGRAGEAIGAAERAEKSMSEARTNSERFLALPGEVMTAGDQAARDILIKHGFTEDEARRMTLTMDPKGAIGKGIANMFKARTEGGIGSSFLKTLLPFKRTAANIVEQGLERTPGIGYLVQKYSKDAVDQDPMSAQHAQQGLGAAVFLSAYQLGKHTDPANDKVMRKFLSNVAGPYSMLASAGLAAGQAARKGSTLGRQLSAGTASALGDMPLPTTRTPTEVGEFFFRGLEGKPLHPQKEGPGRYLPRAAYPGILDKLSDPETQDLLNRLLNGSE